MNYSLNNNLRGLFSKLTHKIIAAASCFLITNTVIAQPSDSSLRTYISGRLGYGTQSDTITLYLHQEFISPSGKLGTKDTLETISKDGRFYFKLPPIIKPTYITLSTSARLYRWRGLIQRQSIFQEYLIMPGDSIIIQSDLVMTRFTGKGGERMQAWQAILLNERYRFFDLPSTEFTITLEDRKKLCIKQDSLLSINLAELEVQRKRLSARDFQLLLTDIIGRNRSYLYRIFCTDYLNGIYNNDTAGRDSMVAMYGRRYVHQKLDTNSADLKANSYYYVNYTFYKLLADHYYRNATYQLSEWQKKDFERDDYFSLISASGIKGLLREKVLIFWMLRNTAFTIINDHQIDNILSILTTNVYRQMALSIKNTFGSGMPVADFSFSDNNGQLVRLSDFKGKLVLIDMWFTGCTGCVKVAEGLKTVEKAFEDNENVVFISLSIDKTKETWLRSIDPYKRIGSEVYSYTHYTTPGTVYLYTNGTGSDNPFIKRYVPTNTYPHLLLVGRDQKVYSGNPPMPFGKKGEQELISLIKKGLK